MNTQATTQAADIMHQPLVTIAPDESVHTLEQSFVEHRVTGIPVVEQDKLVGIVTRSDLVRLPMLYESLQGYVDECSKWMGDGDPQHDKWKDLPTETGRDWITHLQVRHVMRHDVITCTPQDTIHDVARLMAMNHVHRVVVAEDEKPVGIVSSLDLVCLLAECDQ